MYEILNNKIAPNNYVNKTMLCQDDSVKIVE